MTPDSCYGLGCNDHQSCALYHECPRGECTIATCDTDGTGVYPLRRPIPEVDVWGTEE